MAEITPKKSDDNKIIRWNSVGNGDTFGSILIASGKHTVECKGTFDSAVVDLHHGFDSSNMDAIDTDAAPDGLRFSADGVATLEIAGGYVQGSFSTAGSGSEDIDLTITKID